MARAKSDSLSDRMTPEELSAKIARDTEEFLNSGKEIQQIPVGVSGQVTTTGPRHLKLGKPGAT